jgi:hypothetical protein
MMNDMKNFTPLQVRRARQDRRMLSLLVFAFLLYMCAEPLVQLFG